MRMQDFCSSVAEFYDLVPRAHPEGERVLRAALSDVDPAVGTAVDIGSGTGRTVRIIADALPGTPIVACEPAPGMRAVLTHAVIGDDDLRGRVTIMAEPAETVALPDPISALVLFGVLGYLDPDERRALWDRALPRLAPGAPVVVELLPIARPAPLARMNLARERIGELTYEAWMTGEPVGGDIMRLTSTWTVSGAATEPRVVRNTSEWHTFGVENLAEETGLAVEHVAGHIGVLRAPCPARTPAG
ncbi:trans-aconitate 2-methyltransferase [Actinokineospora sp. UTMC 2448]|uniref:class I SAM-dependent methyltransferase n=1 Tax=Actinokineospora sp. UTMC 2448 TaxID=2268449 RepID=UPI0021649C40|nr:class I SAM-dependent methyltransferase [Actinokineospora sp. UTMC 2448]